MEKAYKIFYLLTFNSDSNAKWFVLSRNNIFSVLRARIPSACIYCIYLKYKWTTRNTFSSQHID